MIYRLFALVLIAVFLTACAAAPERPATDRPIDVDDGFSSPDAELNYRLLIGEIALSRGELAEAAASYLRAMMLTDDPGIAERAAQLALHLGRTDDAAQAAARWRALEAQATGPAEIELVTALRRGDAPAALDTASRLLEYWGAPREEAYQALGRLLLDEPDRDAAAALMRGVTTAHDHGAAWQVYGLLALRAGDTDAARQAAHRARTLEPESTQAAVLESRVLALSGEVERGLALMRAIVAEHPRDPTLRFALAGLYLAGGEQRDALNELEQVVAEVPSYTDARWTLAVLLSQLGELDAAEPHFVALLADPLRRWDIPYYLGGIYEQRGDWHGALEWFDQVEWGDQLINARIKAAHMLFKLGRTDEAVTRLSHLHREFPAERHRLFRAEAELHTRAGDAEQALDVYDRAVGEMPDHPGLRYSRALQRERMGLYDAAIADLRHVHALQPDSAQAQNALGYVLADRGPPDAWAEARELIARALEQEPDNAAFIDSMGWVLYRLGDLEGAREWLRRAWTLQPDAEIGAHLGEVLWQLGERDAARIVWQEAADLDPEDSVLVETLQRFTQ